LPEGSLGCGSTLRDNGLPLMAPAPVATTDLTVNQVSRTLLLKLEPYSLYGSIKGRNGASVWANIAGEADPNIGVIKPTPGNSGLALAGIAALHGVRFTAVVGPRSSASVVEGACGSAVRRLWSSTSRTALVSFSLTEVWML
jgi:cysteine synthase